MRVGVLALQGGVSDHVAILRDLGADTAEIRHAGELTQLDGLVLPGGESTAIGRLARDLAPGLRSFERPMFGTCAGLNLLARDAVDGAPGQLCLGRLDVTVERNGYGRQPRSFEAAFDLCGAPYRGVFIRAPKIVRSGPEVEVLAALDGDPVLLRQGNVLAASFHPELTSDRRVHECFLKML
jgi:5'-phosphate synthase pdxT subunit